RGFASVVPRSAAAIDGERHAFEGGALDAHRAGGDLKLDPLAGGGQGTHIAATSGPVRAVGDVVRPPIGAMIRTSVIPVEHDLAREVGGVEINVGIESIADGDIERGVGPIEVV